MGAHRHEVVRTVNQVYVIMVKAVIAAKSQPNLYVYPRIVRNSSHEMKVDTYQNTTNHRNFQRSRNDPENNSLQQKGDTSTSPLCQLTHNQHKKHVRTWCPDQSPASSPPSAWTGGTADQDSTGARMSPWRLSEWQPGRLSRISR